MKFEVLDLTGTSYYLHELSQEEKAELGKEKYYWEFSSKEELKDFASGIASEVDDPIKFRTVASAVNYLEVMNYQVKEQTK